MVPPQFHAIPVNTIGEKASTCFILLQNNYQKALQTPTIDTFY